MKYYFAETNKVHMIRLTKISILPIFFILMSLELISESDYNPFEDNRKTFEISINGGYSIITHEKSIFWDDGLTFGLGINYYFTNDFLIGVSAGQTAYRPRPEISQIDREYIYEIYPLNFNFQYKFGKINQLEIFGGIGLAYVYGEYTVDNFQYFDNGQRLRIRYVYASNGLGVIPNVKVRSPFGDDFAVDFSVDYSLLFMESRNNAVLSLDHINAKIALVYVF